MAARGRKPKPEAGKNGPGEMPGIPPFIDSDEGRRVWFEYGPQINALGLLETLDAPAFAMLCESFALLDDMRTEFAGNPEFTICVGENGAVQPNPLLTEIGKQAKAILALLGEFGMTPVSRQKLTGSTSACPVDLNADPMAQLFDEAENALDFDDIDPPGLTLETTKPKRRATKKKAAKKKVAKKKAAKKRAPAKRRATKKKAPAK